MLISSEVPTPLFAKQEILDRLLRTPSGIFAEYTLPSPDLTAGEMRRLVMGRATEVVFSEDSNHLWINERLNEIVNAVKLKTKYAALFKRLRDGKLSAHLHPCPNEGLSWNDIWNIMDGYNPKARYALFHQAGGLEYTLPKAPNGSLLSLSKEFSQAVGVDVIPVYHTGRKFPELPHISHIPPTEQVNLAMQFARRYGMIRSEALWSDVRGMKNLLEIVNLRY